MLNRDQLEEFLGQLLRHSRDLEPISEAQLQQLAHEGAQELQAKLMAQTPVESALQLGAVEGTVNQVTKLPTPPQSQEDPDGLFDPQRDISPG